MTTRAGGNNHQGILFVNLNCKNATNPDPPPAPQSDAMNAPINQLPKEHNSDKNLEKTDGHRVRSHFLSG